MLSSTFAVLQRPRTYWLRRWGVNNGEHWALNEASGVAVASISAADNLTDNNNVESASGLTYPTARHFTAADSESLSLADNATMSTGDIGFMAAVEVYLDSATAVYRPIMTKGYVAGTREWIISKDDAHNIYFAVSGNGTADSFVNSSFGPISTATFYRIAVYHDPVNDLIGISVNGGAWATAAHTTGAADRASAFRIGTDGAGVLFWNGRIGNATFAKNPPLGVAAVKDEFRTRIASGKPYPWR